MKTSFDKGFFAGNRRQLADKVQNGVVVLAGYRQMQRRNDMAHSFEQESNFWYLTGVTEPQLQMIYDGQRDKCWLVRPELSEIERIFEGEATDESLLKSSGADELIGESQFEDVLRQLARRHSAVYTIQPSSGASVRMVPNPALRDLSQRLSRIFNSVQDCSVEMAQIRAIKQPAELKAIQRAIDLTTSAFDEVRQLIDKCQYEYQVESEFTYRFRSKNALHAYDPIVAAGRNACTLHYIANNQKLKKGDLVLIDIGAQLDGYSADVTRTYAFGEPSKRKVDLHAALRQAHHEIIGQIQPNMPVIEYQNAVDAAIGQALVETGLSSDGRIEDVRKYMPHAISHGLGVDVHDSLGKTKLLRPGMVLTVEPGIYIPEEGIGLRIEDDIAVIDSGVRNLSQSLSTDWR